MTECHLLKGCPFFNDVCEDMPSSSEYLKKQYCRGDYNKCARYYVYGKTDGKGVPSCLFPNEMDKTEKIIREYIDYQKK